MAWDNAAYLAWRFKEVVLVIDGVGIAVFG
jgi:hypothetical protein